MPATQEDFALRLQRLERDIQELASRVSSPRSHATDLAEQISFHAWMKISAPTFAVLVAGFTLLWNAQQASSRQLFEMSHSLGRLDGAIDRLDASMLRINERMDAFDGRLESFDARLESFDARLESFDGSLESFDATVARLARAVERLANDE